MKKVFLLMAMMGIVGISRAQLELSPHASYETPLDELKWIYKPGNSYALTIAKTDKYKKKRTSWGGTIGYVKFTPKKGIFYYLVNEDDIGTISYSDYTIYQLAVNVRHDFILNKTIELFFGGELGYYYVHYEYEAHDTFIDEDATNVESRGALAPRAGISFILLPNVTVFVQGRYTVSISPSDNAANQMNYHWSTGVGLNFRFE